MIPPGVFRGLAGAGVEGFEAEVVEDEEIGAAEGFDQARMAPRGGIISLQGGGIIQESLGAIIPL